MSIESLALLVGALVGTLIIGYLAATLLTRKKLSDAQTALQQAQSTAEQLTQKYAEVDSAHTNLQAKHRVLELGNNTLIAQHEALTKNHAAIEQQNKLTNEKLATETAARHNAETEKQTAQTELAANKTAQESLQSRLDITQSEVKAERQKLNEQIQRNAELDTQAKSAQVLAQENESKYKEQKTQRESLQEKYDVVQTKSTGLFSENAELKTAQTERDTSHKQQLEQQEQAHTTLLAKHKLAEEKLAAATTERHTAQTENQAAQTELSENKKAQESLQARLSGAQSEVLSERTQLGQQLQRNAELDKHAKAEEIKAQETESKYKDQKVQFDSLQLKFDTLQNTYTSITREHTELKTALDERDRGHTQQLAQFEEQKKALSEQFKLLANDILEAKTTALQESSKLTLTSVMNPFQQSMDIFKKEVQEIHHRETTQQGELRKELESLKELNQKITTEAHELSTALRGQKKLQGNWGELILENVLDRSGLVLDKDYKREVSINTEEGRQRPDVVVYLPQKKHLIIDAKVSLNAYTRFINSTDDAERAKAIAEHVKAISDRINELANRDYYKLPGLNSPEMVFMFIPIESAFVEALKADESLFQKAIEKHVLVATPTTLLTSLNIVRQLWRYEDQNKHTAALANKAENVFKKLNSFLDSFEGIKKGLEKANEAYGKAENQLISGKGNLVKQVGDFKNLAPAIKAELPSYFTDKAALEIDYIPADQQLPNSGSADSTNDTELIILVPEAVNADEANILIEEAN